MKRLIIASNQYHRSIQASDQEDTRVEDLSRLLKDDFDYALDGFDKMARNGKISEALDIMNTLGDEINVAIENSAIQIAK